MANSLKNSWYSIYVLAPAILILAGCSHRSECALLLNSMRSDFRAGSFGKLAVTAKAARENCGDDPVVSAAIDSLTDMAERIRLDFRIPEEEALKMIEKRVGPFTEADRERWESKGWLENRIIDGKKLYFGRAVSNLVLLRRFYEDREKSEMEDAAGPEMKARLKHTSEALKLAAGSGEPVLPVSITVTYTITVKPDAVPPGEIIRCWMPWPKVTSPRQDSVELIETSAAGYSISPDSAIHSSIYMEKRALNGQPATFMVKYRYVSKAQHFSPERIRALPYDRNSDFYKKYTSEQAPQIHFSRQIIEFADSITGGLTDPKEIVRKIYLWFKRDIPWTGALEYSIMPDIPGYVWQHRRGDCGMQTLLYMSMLRYKGIPVRWQSGWMVPPGYENLHDWCEIWFEGTGWVPSDVSYDLQSSDDEALKEFYMTGIDSYRMIVNSGISGNFYPEKRFPRSEPYDFQRGEVEWKGGNLYFNKWDYNMSLEYSE